MYFRAYSSVVWIFHTCAKFSHPAWKFRTCVKNSNYRWIVWNFHIHKSWPWMWKFHMGVWKFHKGCENFIRGVKISHMCEKFKLQMIRLTVWSWFHKIWKKKGRQLNAPSERVCTKYFSPKLDRIATQLSFSFFFSWVVLRPKVLYTHICLYNAHGHKTRPRAIFTL